MSEHITSWPKAFNEEFSRIIFTEFWKKNMHKPTKIMKHFLSQNRLPLKSSKNYSFGYYGCKLWLSIFNKSYKKGAFATHEKHLNIKLYKFWKTAFWYLAFSPRLPIWLCFYLQLSFKQMYTWLCLMTKETCIWR